MFQRLSVGWEEHLPERRREVRCDRITILLFICIVVIAIMISVGATL